MKIKLSIDGDITPLIYVEDPFTAGDDWKGRLFSPDTGQEWAACSGPYGKGPAPRGIYNVRKPIPISDVEENKPYRDAEGNAWFAAMQPMKGFESERQGLGIHPDGNVPGTLGCIGIRKVNEWDLLPQDLFTLLAAASEPIILYVV